MNLKENDNEIIELTDKELDEIFADDDFDNGEEDGEIRSFHFSNPDPYAKVKPRLDDAPKREFSFDAKGNIVVKNPSAFWLPDVKIVEEHGGTEYTVTGSYEGTETLDKKLRRYISSTTLWATFPWMSCKKRNRHDRNHACFKKWNRVVLPAGRGFPLPFFVVMVLPGIG